MLFGCTECMQFRWVCHWSWRSALPVPWLVVSVGAISTVLEDGGEEFQFLFEEVFVAESLSSAYQGSED